MIREGIFTELSHFGVEDDDVEMIAFSQGADGTHDSAFEALVAVFFNGIRAVDEKIIVLGKVMLGFARQESELALEKLATVSPTDAVAITALQNRAAHGRQFEQWLMELLHEGEQALQVFKQQQSE